MSDEVVTKKKCPSGGEVSGVIDIGTCGEDVLPAFRAWHKANPGAIHTATPYGFFLAGWRAAKLEGQ